MRADRRSLVSSSSRRFYGVLRVDPSESRSDFSVTETSGNVRAMPKPRPRTPFPRYERISEELAEERSPTAPRHERPQADAELDRPRTESYAELWQRASARGLTSGR
jgi:hypothetical protein